MTVNNDKQHTNIAAIMAVIFCAFSFSYLFYYQADILAYGQHVLSEGKTTYNDMVGAIVITVVLYLLHLGIRAMTLFIDGHDGRDGSSACPSTIYILPALTYIPSALSLALITHISTDTLSTFSFLKVTLWFLAFIIIYIVVAWMAKLILSATWQQPSANNTMRRTWVNTLIMTMLMLIVTSFGTHGKSMHNRLSAERAIMRGDCDRVLDIARVSKADNNMTMLCAYALAKKGELGEHIFEYPLAPNSNALLPHGLKSNVDTTRTALLLMPLGRYYQIVGKWLKQPMPPIHYLKFCLKTNNRRKATADYLLTALLMDCKLDEFAKTLPRFYSHGDSLDSNLPKHYREALILYNHLRKEPHLIYTDNVFDADYQDMQSLLRSEGNEAKRRKIIHDTYSGSYWNYYYQQANAHGQHKE